MELTDVLKLLVRRGDLPSKNDSQPELWTTFEMTLREHAPIPQPYDLTRFLASSITFMVHIRSVSVFLDSHRLAHLTKSSGVPKELGLLKGLKNSSGSGLMSVVGVQSVGEHSSLLLLWSEANAHDSSHSYPSTSHACSLRYWH